MSRTLLVLVLLPLALVPTVSADDQLICQPTPTSSTCVRIITDDGWVYASTCSFGAGVAFCLGGGHWDYAPPSDLVGNGAGGYACASTLCVATVAGQESYSGYFLGYGGVGVSSDAASASAAAIGGTQNGAPYEDGLVCAGTFATGGTCLML